jgi:ATP-dependent RNA helicase SUPV3L1/SUV3
MLSRGLFTPAERQCHICALGLSRQRRAWSIASRQVSTTTAVEKQQRAFPREGDRATYESFAHRLGGANAGRNSESGSRSGPGDKPRGFDQRGLGQRRSRRPNHGKLPNETKPAPTLEQLRHTLIRRLEPWIYSETTLKKLDSLGIGIEDAEALLNDFQGVAIKSLKGPGFGAGASQTTETPEAPFALEWDVEGLTLSFQHDADWMKSVERAYLRQFLRWATHEQTTGVFSLPEPLVVRIREILETTDLSHLASQFNEAREMHRQFHLHIGPTNSGKTYNALKALAKAKTGAYAGPLRLLAHEVWERMNRGTVGGLEDGQGRECNLITGEERRIVSLEAGLTSCTVEMLSFNTPLDVVVIDEIQMIGDPQRGGSWTNAVMGLLAKEIHLCGEETVVPVIQKLVAAMGDELVIHRYERLTPLKVLNESLGGDLSKVEDGDCVVSFSRSGIFALKKAIEEKRGKRCAVVYGALPPETRSEQARLFNEPGNGIDVMVASDAVGMGLNL